MKMKMKNRTTKVVQGRTPKVVQIKKGCTLLYPSFKAIFLLILTWKKSSTSIQTLASTRI